MTKLIIKAKLKPRAKIMNKTLVHNKSLDSKLKIQIEAGKSYKLKYPDGGGDTDKLHIDYILNNPLSDAWWHKLVVCRYWGKNKQRWYYYIYPYYALAIYNGWKVPKGY